MSAKKQHRQNLELLYMKQLNPKSSTFNNRIHAIGQAVFYCQNESSQKIPVCVVTDAFFSANDTIEFSASRFPLMENDWNIFGGELDFYKKGLPFSYKLHGIAIVKSVQPLTIQFKIKQTEYTGTEAEHHYSLLAILSSFFSSTGSFIKKVWVSGF